MKAKIAVETFPGEPGKYFTGYVSQVCDFKSSLSSQGRVSVHEIYFCVLIFTALLFAA